MADRPWPNLVQPETIETELPQRFPLLRMSAPAPPYDPRLVVFGLSEQGQPVTMPDRPRFEHAHVIGTTGGGKTNFLEHLIRQDIKKGDGVVVVDPHGDHPDSLYRSLITWMDAAGYLRSRCVHLIDPNFQGYTTGFNPLALPSPDTDVSVVAGVTLEAFERVWGDEDTHAKPTIRRLLKADFAALAELGLTLSESELLFDQSDSSGLRAFALSKLKDRYARTVLNDLDVLAQTDRNGLRFRDEVVGPLNRLAEFLSAPAIRRIVGQCEHAIDFRKCLDEGHIILVNLSGGTSVNDADTELLGRLLTRLLFFHVKLRKGNRPCWFYLDECQKYLSGDIPAVLAEARKFKLGVILSHQWQSQLGDADSQTLAAVHNATNLKAAFRIKHPKEAKEVAEAVLPIAIEEPVKVLIKPTVIGHKRTWFRNRGIAEHESKTDTVGESFGQSISYTEGENWSSTEGESSSRTDSESLSDTISDSTSESSSFGRTDSTNESISSSETNGWSVSDTDSTGRGASEGQTDTVVPFDQMDDPQAEPVILSTNLSRATSSTAGRAHAEARNGSESRSRASSRGRALSSSQSIGSSTGRALSKGTSTSFSNGRSSARTVGGFRATTESKSYSISRSTALSRGTSKSFGESEGLEPIYQDLPSAVHSFENSLYVAATLLRSLPTGHAYMNFVDAEGMKAARVRVPLVSQVVVPAAAFSRLRERILSASAFSTPAHEAERSISRREDELLRLCRAIRQTAEDYLEPESFRVPVKGRSPDK